jgi:putative sulfotransferase
MALSVSELFSGLRDHDLTEREMSGAEFWDMLSTPCQTDTVGLRCQIKLDEMLYPALAPRPGADRFTWETGLPPLMQACIPHLTDRPDDMYAWLEATADQPRRLLSEHLRWLFGMLAQSQAAVGRDPRIIVERSGGSLTYASMLLRMFPEARIVHLFRDGRECAVSMSRHGRYKMAMIRAALWARLGYDPYADADGHPAADAESLGEELAGLTPDRITRARYDHYEVPLSRYGGMWTKMIVDGLAELGDRQRVLTLDYGELIAKPAATIGKLLDFLDLTRDPPLEERMAAQVRPARDVRGEVGEQQWRELTRSCHLGMNRLYGRSNWK